jgi:hypothetical protein
MRYAIFRATLAGIIGDEPMVQTTSAISSVRNIGPGQLKGSARGALICAFFGSAWMYWAVVFSGNPTPAWFSIVTVPAVALIAWAFLRVRAVRQLPSSAAELEHSRAFRKFFWVDVGIEWGLGGVAVFALATGPRRNHRPALSPVGENLPRAALLLDRRHHGGRSARLATHARGLHSKYFCMRGCWPHSLGN